MYQQSINFEELTSFFNIIIKVVIPRYNFDSSSSCNEAPYLVVLYTTINSNDFKLAIWIINFWLLQQKYSNYKKSS